LEEVYVLNIEIVMKYVLLTFSILFVSYLRGFNQESHLVIRTGVGYYMDTFTTDDGPVIWVEGGYRIKTGFNLNARLSMASMNWRIRSGPFEGYETVQLRQMGDITFSKPINIKSQHFLEPGLGFKIKKEYLLIPSFSQISNSNGFFISTSYSRIFYEIGLDLYIDYYYRFSSGFFLGLRADTNVIWALGFEGLTISPLFGFRF
jgi:hypothetical protein